MSYSRTLLLAGALACGLLLAGTGPAHAQRHGGHGHGGHAHVGHAHVGHAHAGHAHAGHWYGGHHHGGSGWALSIGLGLGYGGYGGYGWGYGGYGGYGYPGYYSGYAGYYPSYAGYYSSPVYYSVPAYYSAPVYSVGYSSPVVVSDSPAISGRRVTPTVNGQPVNGQPVNGHAANGTASAPGPNSAKIEVRLPEADASVWVDGRETRAKGAVRTLVSPELVPGKAYGYKVLAAWNRDGKRVAEEKVVEVSAGQSSVVDFTRPNGPDELPLPKELPVPKVPAPPK